MKQLLLEMWYTVANYNYLDVGSSRILRYDKLVAIFKNGSNRIL